jgi:hypothetical protein
LALDSIGFNYLVRVGSATYSTFGWQYKDTNGDWQDFTGTAPSISSHAGAAAGFDGIMGTNTNLADYTGTSGKLTNPSQLITGSPSATSLEIRFHPTNDGNSGALALHDIVISGTVTAIPEPSTYALAGVAAIGIALASRRRKVR